MSALTASAFAARLKAHGVRDVNLIDDGHAPRVLVNHNDVSACVNFYPRGGHNVTFLEGPNVDGSRTSLPLVLQVLGLPTGLAKGAAS